MRRLSLLIVPLILLGCKKNREAEVVGSWTSPNQALTVDAAKTFKDVLGPMTIQGEWTAEGNDFTLTPKTLNSRPVSELKAQLQKNVGTLPAQAKQFVESLDVPNVYTLSDDGKTMTTNKEKDKNGGPPITLTKG